MTGPGEAKPKRARNRRRTYAKRVDFRLTEEQLEIVARALTAASARGRSATLSSILRASLMDGCRSIIGAVEQAPLSSAEDAATAAQAIDDLAEELRLLRTDLRRLGNNVNQLTHIAHQTGRLSADLSAVRGAIDQFDARLVTVAGRALGYGAPEE